MLTAALVNAQPARSAYTRPVNATAAFNTGGPSGSGTVQVNVNPAKAGIDTILVTVLGSSGSPEAVPEIRASLTLRARSLGPAGSWQLALIVRTSEIDETTVAIPVKIH